MSRSSIFIFDYSPNRRVNESPWPNHQPDSVVFLCVFAFLIYVLDVVENVTLKVLDHVR